MFIEKNKNKKYTLEEYLDLEAKADFKSEFIDGRIVPYGEEFCEEEEMGIDEFIRHGHIKSNVITALNIALRKKNSQCMVQSSDLRVYFEKFNNISQPDVMIICGGYEFYEDRKDVIINPFLVAEVFSKSNENYDMGNKFHFYRSLPSLREYVLINQHEAKVESWYKQEENLWKISNAIKIDDSIPLFSIDCEIALSDIYYLIENFNE